MEFDRKELAAEAYLEANYIYPFDLTVHMKLGGVLMDLGRFEEAVREFSVVTEISPRDKGALIDLYNAYKKLQDKDEAADVLKRLKRFFPDEDFSELE